MACTENNFKIIDSVNKISNFLAARDVNILNKEEMLKIFGVEKVDLLILLGNSILYTIQLAAESYKNGLCDKLMIVGGIGHSTEILRNNVKNHKNFKDIKVDGRAEADIIYDIMTIHYGLAEEDLIIENKSTNCGANAIEALKVIKNVGLNPKRIILIQDPSMQLRTYGCFKKSWDEEVTFINYAPFIPILTEEHEVKVFDRSNVEGMWDKERFLSLIMGEIVRLKDDENGYGPNGKNYIIHFEIPDEVMKAFEILKDELKYYLELRK